MKEKDLPIDRTRHAVYTKKAKKCVLRLLHRCYSDQNCGQLWEKIQLLKLLVIFPAASAIVAWICSLLG